MRWACTLRYVCGVVLVKQRGRHQRQQSEQQGARTQHELRCACAFRASSVVNRCISDGGGRRQRQRKVESRRVGMTAFLGVPDGMKQLGRYQSERNPRGTTRRRIAGWKQSLVLGSGWLELEAWMRWVCRVVVGCVAVWLGADGRASQISSHASSCRPDRIEVLW